MFGKTLRSSLLAFIALAGNGMHLRAEDSPHLERLGVNAWHSKGITGKGITVAILDNGFRGYRRHLGKALSSDVQSRSFRNDGNLEARDSIHGLLCAEVIHTIAPDARLLLANWEPDDPASFLKAVTWARENGASIVSCSIVMPGWSDGLGGGDVHRELSKRLDGALMFASAGNLAQRHWTGAFRESSTGMQVWKEGRTENSIIPWGGQPVSVELVARDASSYRLAVVDDDGRLVADPRALSTPGVNGSTLRFAPETGKRYRARIEKLSGRGGEIRLIVLGGELEIATHGGCMVFPGDGKDVIAVGAVSSRNERLSISATGCTGRTVKPDCVAPVPFPSRIRSSPFDGTSAAAPQAAAIAALIWSTEPHTQAKAIRSRLQEECVDIGAPGPDPETGRGVICLPSR